MLGASESNKSVNFDYNTLKQSSSSSENGYKKAPFFNGEVT
ncbi:hypothetical protein A2U01_0110486, partial [Trifolium medium]|nr:hypothetical protein [Trifolium medium]